ncbi:MAG TPA: hypothetical protein EYG03_21440 [Planctomycetes bacterium]|nr:hypothetical protein [Planctomycetota bacterium]
MGNICYPDDPAKPGGPVVGWLIYIKLSVTGNEPQHVTDYRRRYPDFPHQSTADQVYSEDQFEAYHCLGEHVTDDLFSDEILTDKSLQDAKNHTLTVRQWYEELVERFIR